MCVLSDDVVLEERFPWNERTGQVINWERAAQIKGGATVKVLREACTWQGA